MKNELDKYEGVLQTESYNLYTQLRNLYSLAHQIEIIDIISNIVHFEELQIKNERRKQSSLNESIAREELEANGVSKLNICIFQIAVNQIAESISSPMAKLLAYYEQVTLILTEWNELEAEDRIELIQEMLLGFRDYTALENLYIDLKMIENFVPHQFMS